MRREGRLFAPALIVTPRQTAGKGRGKNTWHSDTGTLTVTFALPIRDAHPPHHLPILAGVAVREAVVSLFGPHPIADAHSGSTDITLKWPNDLYVGHRKLAGLLCQRIEHVDLVGVGLNVSTKLSRLPKLLRDRITSLELLGLKPSLTDTLLAITAHLLRATEVREPFPATLRRYDAHHILVNRRIEVTASDHSTLTGLCKGLDTQGRLLLQTSSTLERLTTGTVTSW